jgi:hypothetical protein
MQSVFNDPPFSEDEYENKLLLHKPKFQNGVQRLRQKWGIPDSGFASDKAHDNWRRNRLKDKEHIYKQDVILLLRILELTDRWYPGVSSYITMNAPSVLRVRPNLPVRVDYDESGEARSVHSIWVQIDRDTTQREMIEVFKAAQDILGTSDVKKQKPKNLDRDLRVLEMNGDGIKNTEIAEWLSSNYKGVFNTDDVAKILTRIKQKLK